MASLVVKLDMENLGAQDALAYSVRVSDTVSQYGCVTDKVVGTTRKDAHRAVVLFATDIHSETLPALKATLHDLAQFFNQSMKIVEGITEEWKV